MKYKSSKKNKAFSLIEILLILAIIFTISIAAFFTYKKIDYENKSKFIVDQTNIFAAQGTELYYKYKSEFNDFESSKNKFPMDLFDTALYKKEVNGYAGALAFPAGYYGAELIIYRRENGKDTPFDFAFHAKKLPSDICMNVMSKFLGNKNLYSSIRLIRNNNNELTIDINDTLNDSNAKNIKNIAETCSNNLDPDGPNGEYNTYIGLTVR